MGCLLARAAAHIHSDMFSIVSGGFASCHLLDCTHISFLIQSCRDCGAQVGNYTQLKQYWGHVEDLTGYNPTYSVNIADGASDLGGQVRFLQFLM